MERIDLSSPNILKWRFKLWWSGNGVGSVGGMPKEELYEVLEVRRVSDRMAAVVLVFLAGCVEVDLWVWSENGTKFYKNRDFMMS